MKIKRRITNWIVRLFEWAFYDVRYKKVHLRVRECKKTEPHEEHVWSTNLGYVRGSTMSNYSYVCEGVKDGSTRAA